VKKDTIAGRTGWDQVAAVVHDQIFEVKSTYILQPGPAALTEGVLQIHQALCHVHGLSAAKETSDTPDTTAAS
jgi:iron complex transport system substrate-binding protein